jgi:hypothetical protein
MVLLCKQYVHKDDDSLTPLTLKTIGGSLNKSSILREAFEN